MKVLTRDEILKVEDLKKERVSIPEWNGFIFISELSADTRDDFEQFMFEQRKASRYTHIRSALVAMTAVNENGERLFSFEDIEKLGKKSGLILDRLFDVANKLNKIYGTEREDVEKNSAAPQGDNSGGE